jgi:putative redox protein
VDGERAEEHPKVFTTMQIVYKFWGENLEEDKLRKAIDLSLNKYCSVSNTVNKVAKIDYRLELNP